MHSRRGITKRMPSLHVGPNMTPMVDIVMCILIFFMLGTTLAQPEVFLRSNTAAIDKEGLGSEQGTQKLPSVRMNIKLARVTQAGKQITVVTAFNEATLPMNAPDDPQKPLDAAIEALLKKRRAGISDDVQVLIVPDKNVPYQDVITIYDLCVKLSFKQVAFYPVK